MTAHKIEIVVLDTEDMTIEDVTECIESNRHLLSVQVIDSVSKSIPEWDDDHILNCSDTIKEKIDEFFEKD